MMKIFLVLFILVVSFSTSLMASIYLSKENWPVVKTNKNLKGWMGYCPKNKVCYKLIGKCHPADAVLDDKAMTATCPKKK